MTVECPACNTSFPVDPNKVPPEGVHARCSVCSEVFFVEVPPEDTGALPSAEVMEAPAEDFGAPVDDVEAAAEAFEAPADVIEAPTEDFGAPTDEVEAAPEEGEAFAEEASMETAPEEVASAFETETTFGDDVVFETEDDLGTTFGGGEPAFETTEPAFGEAEPTFGDGESTFTMDPPELGTVEEAPAEPVPSFDEAREAPVEAVSEAVEEPVEAAEPEVPATPLPTPSFGKRDPKEKAQRLARVLVSDIILYNPDRHQRALEEGRLKEDFDDEVKKSWSEYVDQVGEEIANSTNFFNEALNEILAKGEQLY
ncbi:zinc-ribbon domain-containing protein [Gemmatimonadota bacterium]